MAPKALPPFVGSVRPAMQQPEEPPPAHLLNPYLREEEAAPVTTAAPVLIPPQPVMRLKPTLQLRVSPAWHCAGKGKGGYDAWNTTALD